MLLVATGLLFIVARIALRRSNDWLIRLNLIVLTATLYACSLTNFAAIVADYNVSHSHEASGKGVAIDIYYLYRLGPETLPALDRAARLVEDTSQQQALVSCRFSLVEQFRSEAASWRTWSLRGWRLKQYLDEQTGRSPG